MRHPQLHAALRTAALHAGRELAGRVDDGDEVPFELLEHTRGSARRVDAPTLYSYRPLVGLYVERHAEVLGRLPAVAEAAHAMVAAWGVEAYLEARGVSRPPADPHARAALAVRQFLERLFEDAPDFDVQAEHFDRAFAELDAVLTSDATETVVAIPLTGVEITIGTVAITRGVALQQPETLRGEVPDAALAGPDGTPADAVATLRWGARPGSPDTPRRAREAARRLVTALRLHCPGASPAAGPLVWLRPADGPWRAMALGGTFTAHGHVVLGVDDVPDLQTFVELVARRLPEQGDVAWALRRWTLGLDRDRPEEALSDLLLAGRALLEPEGPRSGRLAGRLAALVAPDAERAGLARRLAALALTEQDVMAGSRRVGKDLPERVDELADCLRAVLRDCVCGHLSGDLVVVADEVLDGVVDEPEDARGQLRERVLAAVRRPLAGREQQLHHAGVAARWEQTRQGATRDDRWDEPEDEVDGDVQLEEDDRWEDEPRAVAPRGAPSRLAEAADVEDAADPEDDARHRWQEEHAGDRTASGEWTGEARIWSDEASAAAPAAARPPHEDEPTGDRPPILVTDRRGRGPLSAVADDRGPVEAPADDAPPAGAPSAEGDGPAAVIGPAVAWTPADAVDEAPPIDVDELLHDERLAEVDREALWLEQTWDEPQLAERSDDDDDATGPWPVAANG